jgi:hypothetical protein
MTQYLLDTNFFIEAYRKSYPMDVFLDADEADAWLVAYALKFGFPLVTNEVSAPDSKKSIKIPDACVPFGVRAIQPMDLFRELGEKM